jgi:outer membrane protein assembly factor BamB
MNNSVHTFLGLVCLASVSVYGADWPQWRGANRDARAEFKAPKTWPKELTKKWNVAVGEGVASPALVGDKLYVFSRQEGNEVLRCLDVATGKELWQDKYEALGATGPASSFSGPRSSPAVANGKVVTVGVRGIVSCLDASSGKKLWRKDDFQSAPMFFASSSPIIVDQLCVAQLGGRDSGAVAAYDLASGEQKWKWSGPSPAYASPVLQTIGAAKLIVAQTEGKLVGVNAADGKLAWEAPGDPQPGPGGPGGGPGRGGGGRDYKAATPIIDGQNIIVAGRGIKAIKVEKEGDGFATKELWSNSEKSVQFNTPVLKNGFLYGLTPDNEFFCINAQNGQTAWSAPLSPTAAPAGGGGAEGPPPGGGRGRGGRGGGYGSIVDAGSVMLALTPSSELIAFQPSDKSYTELARIKVADTQTHAYPIISGNRIVIKDKDSVTLWTIE